VIYTASATDVDTSDTRSYSLKTGTGDVSLLDINASTGAVTLRASANYETKASYTFTVIATDAGGLSAEQAVTVAVTNVNEAPVFTTTNLSTTYTDTSATDTFSNSTGTFSATDVDANTTLSYGISDGTVSGSTMTKVGTYGSLSINSATGAYTYTPNNSAINALTTTQTDAFTISVSDGSLSTTTNYSVMLNGVAEVVGAATISGSLLDSSDQIYAVPGVLQYGSNRIDEYRIAYTGSGIVAIDMIGSSFDTTLHVIEKNSVGAKTLVAYNDDYYGLLSYVTFTPLNGYTYQVYVGSFYDSYVWSSGAYIINATNALLSFSGGSGTTPLILDLNYDSVHTLGTDAGVQYDITGSGLQTSVGWSSPEDGFLVRDINNDGLINDGTEMFGEATVLVNGERAQDGFEALSDLDTNQDGLIDSQDQAFNSLAIWRDANTDGETDAGELLTLAQNDIASLNLSYTESDRVDNGNQLRLVSNYTTTDGTSYEMVDVWLTTNYQTNMAETPAVPAVLEKLTDTAGQDNFEVSQLVFHEQYSQRAMESALDYYLDEQDASELSQAIFEIHGGDSTKPSEVRLAGLLQNYANDETDQDQLSFTGFSDSATIETRNIMTSSNKEFAYTYVSDQQIDKNVYTGLLIDLGLSATPNHDEILHLEIKKN
jgi:hypothetical protein